MPVKLWAALGLTLALLAACTSTPGKATPVLSVSGDSLNGSRIIKENGCGSCHRIPGIAGANALVGPPLDHWSERAFIAGTLSNSPENLARWLTSPQEIRPGTAMPTPGLSDQEVADVVAYLYSID
jgi:cytochrome c1